MGPKFTILPFPGVAHTTYPLSSTLEPLGLKYSLSLSLSLIQPQSSRFLI